jgi:MSHA biogenesis protein MshJ
MNARGAVMTLAGRFDRMSLRERMLTTAAVLAVVLVLFDSLVLQRLELRRKELAQQLTEIVAAINDTGTAGDGSDAGATLRRTAVLAASLNEATARLHSQAAGLVPPQRMTQVIHDVLSREQGVTVISLRSLTPYALVEGDGPYVHSVELTLQGRYLDILTYLQALEGLPWHFYWQSLALDATHYPTTRVTVRLGTVSMSREWIDL